MGDGQRLGPIEAGATCGSCFSCGKSVNDEDLCYGCGAFICIDCDNGLDVTGRHKRENHLGVSDAKE